MLIKQFRFKDYPREVSLGVIRPKYYKQGTHIPKYLSNKIDYLYAFDKKGILIDLHTKKPLLKNPNQAGTVRKLVISGNSIHRISDSEIESKIQVDNYVKIKTCLKNFYLDNLPFTDYIIKEQVVIEFIFITTKEDVLALGKENDLDNYKQFYEKAFLDSIQSKIWDVKEKKLIHNEKAIVENDNMNYIVRLEHEIQIKDYRELIINIKRYNKQ
jgi:hypothetical protein